MACEEEFGRKTMQNVRKTINMNNSDLNGNPLDLTKNETAMNSGVAPLNHEKLCSCSGLDMQVNRYH